MTGGKGWGRHYVATRPGGQATTRRPTPTIRPLGACDTAPCALYVSEAQIGLKWARTSRDLRGAVVRESPLGIRARIRMIGRGCELEISGTLLTMDLGILDMSEFDVILGMD